MDLRGVKVRDPFGDGPQGAPVRDAGNDDQMDGLALLPYAGAAGSTGRSRSASSAKVREVGASVGPHQAPFLLAPGGAGVGASRGPVVEYPMGDSSSSPPIITASPSKPAAVTVICIWIKRQAAWPERPATERTLCLLLPFSFTPPP